MKRRSQPIRHGQRCRHRNARVDVGPAAVPDETVGSTTRLQPRRIRDRAVPRSRGHKIARVIPEKEKLSFSGEIRPLREVRSGPFRQRQETELDRPTPRGRASSSLLPDCETAQPYKP